MEKRNFLISSKPKINTFTYPNKVVFKSLFLHP